MKTPVRTGIAGLAALLLLFTLAACGGGSSANPDRALRVAVPADVSALDPIRGNAGSDHVMLYTLYDTLISFNAGLEAEPGLAESWKQTSPTALTLTLRDGVKFHDGTDLDAEAVKFNIERAQGEGSNIAADIASVKSVKVVDPLTVTLKLAHPDSSLLMALADRAGMMVSPTAAQKADNDLTTAPVGTGAWKFDEWKHGAQLRVTRFQDYWNKDVERVSAIEFNVVPDPKTRVTSLRSGQQDIALEVSPSEAAGLEAASGVELEQHPRMYLEQVYMNRKSEELGDPRVRRALSLAIDRESIVKSAYFDRATPASGALPGDYWAAPPSDVDYPYDPDQARALLKEAGAEGLTFDMIANADSATVRVAEILKAQWKDIGVTVNIRPLEVVQATSDYFNDRKAPALLSAWTGRPDPAMTYRLMFTGEGYFNTSHESVPGIEDALTAVDAAATPEERKPGLDMAAQAVYEDTPFLPIAFSDLLIGRSESVKGFEGNLLGKPKFLGVTLG